MEKKHTAQSALSAVAASPPSLLRRSNCEGWKRAKADGSCIFLGILVLRRGSFALFATASPQQLGRENMRDVGEQADGTESITSRSNRWCICSMDG